MYTVSTDMYQMLSMADTSPLNAEENRAAVIHNIEIMVRHYFAEISKKKMPSGWQLIAQI